MRPSPLSRTRGQKVMRMFAHRTHGERNPETMNQYFQISINVLEAKKLSWSNPHNANSYVLLVLDKTQYRTPVINKIREPFYGELFVFDMFVNIREMLRSSVWLAVMETNNLIPPRLIGEATIDIGAIWVQLNHTVLQKWVQLTEAASAGPVGFLKLDISITRRGEVYDSSTALRPGPSVRCLTPRIIEKQRASYIVTLYSAYALPSDVHQCFDRRTWKPPSTFVRVSFCGLMAKTSIQPRSNNPSYNEQICIGEMFPNLSQIILIEICVPGGLNSRVIASKELRLQQISYDGENGFIPTFGPTLLHLTGGVAGKIYESGMDSPYYGGALLVSVRTKVPSLQLNLRTTSVEPVTPLQTNNLWDMMEFSIVCPVLEVSMLDISLTGKICRVAVTIGEIKERNALSADHIESFINTKSKQLHFTRSLMALETSSERGYINFYDGYPVIQTITTFPDFRFRMYRNNMILRIFFQLDRTVKNVDRRFESFDYDSPQELMHELKDVVDIALSKITNFIDVIQKTGKTDNSILKENCTELDRMQFNVQAEEMETIVQMFVEYGCDYSNLFVNNTRRAVKNILSKTKIIIENLKNIIFLTPRPWPDVVVWILSSGSRVAYCKISAADVIYSKTMDQCGVYCGVIQSLLLKPLNCLKHHKDTISACNCVAAKIEILMWMGASNEKDNFSTFLPPGYDMKFEEDVQNFTVHSKPMLLEYRAFIYKGKFRSQQHSAGLYSFLRIYSGSSFGETMIQRSKDPIWDETVTIMNVVNMSPERLKLIPSDVVVEVFFTKNDNKVNQELIGRFQVKPEVGTRNGFDNAPPLKWYDIENDTDVKAQILMSLQVVQADLDTQATSKQGHHPFSDNFHAFQALESIPNTPLPFYLKPVSSQSKIDIYWWGLRNLSLAKKPCAIIQIDELKVKSNFITVVDNKRNCNFTKSCRTSYSAGIPVEDVIKSPMRVKLYDKGTYGRTVLLGFCLKNPNKYLIKWLSKSKRESLIKPFESNYFVKMSPMLYILNKQNKNSLEDAHNIIYDKNIGTHSNIVYKSSMNLTRWWTKYIRKEPKEEECALLPLVKSTKRKQSTFSNQLWWMRFYIAQKTSTQDVYSNGLIIYQFELESQPGFKKFKDWCCTLRLFNGKKIGIPDKDQLIYCGSLKVGIVLYSWPPLPNTIAVTRSGKELNKSYFDGTPSNDPLPFIVRVYVVKGLNLGLKYNNNIINPYLVLTCGRKKIEDRKSYVPMCDDPIFGKAYELHGTLPDDYRLTVSVYDYIAPGQDELIGTTVIDLEDRIYTKHKACVGLAPKYKISGSAQWMDSKRPSDILKEVCRENNFNPPEFPDHNSVSVNGVVYRDDDCSVTDTESNIIETKENICLKLLRSWSSLPVCGYPLVPEHVEMRTLYLKPDHQDAPMGKLQMWVDIYCVKNAFDIPPPRDISPPKSVAYELVLTIHRISNVTPVDRYRTLNRKHLKVWLGDTQLCKKTDDMKSIEGGDLIVDWKTDFEFYYDHAKEELSLNNEEEKKFMGCASVPPRLVMQLWESETLLGESELLIDNMQIPTKNKKSCYVDMQNRKEDTVNMFITSQAEGWVPLRQSGRKTNYVIGVMELALSLHPQQSSVLDTDYSKKTMTERITKECLSWEHRTKLYNILIIFCLLASFMLLLHSLPSIRISLIKILKKWVHLTMNHERKYVPLENKNISIELLP